MARFQSDTAKWSGEFNSLFCGLFLISVGSLDLPLILDSETYGVPFKKYFSNFSVTNPEPDGQY